MSPKLRNVLKKSSCSYSRVWVFFSDILESGVTMRMVTALRADKISLSALLDQPLGAQRRIINGFHFWNWGQDKGFQHLLANSPWGSELWRIVIVAGLLSSLCWKKWKQRDETQTWGQVNKRAILATPDLSALLSSKVKVSMQLVVIIDLLIWDYG